MILYSLYNKGVYRIFTKITKFWEKTRIIIISKKLVHYLLSDYMIRLLVEKLWYIQIISYAYNIVHIKYGNCLLSSCSSSSEDSCALSFKWFLRKWAKSPSWHISSSYDPASAISPLTITKIWSTIGKKWMPWVTKIRV